jgi:hypothetical protein
VKVVRPELAQPALAQKPATPAPVASGPALVKASRNLSVPLALNQPVAVKAEEKR